MVAIGKAVVDAHPHRNSMDPMRKLLPLLALLALLLPAACKDTEKSGTTGTAQQVEYTCKCGKTKTAPVDQAPS
jgi:hypothetical protein